MATFHLTHEDAVALVNQLSSAIRQDDEDTDTVPPAYPAHDMDVQGHQGQGQARSVGPSRASQPHPPSYNTANTDQRVLLQVLLDFEVNEGDQVIPFTITDQFGHLTPAHYIQVHMTDNPYVIAHLTMNGPDYRGELHVMPYAGTEAIEAITLSKKESQPIVVL